jgi:hypothetical protein
VIQQHLVEQREDGCVRANPQRRRQDRDDGEKRRLEERTKSEPEVDHRDTDSAG